MQRFILTGAPGSGKTSLLRQFDSMGYHVVEEAATDVIAFEQERGVQQPWEAPSFIETVLAMQIQRQAQADDSSSEIQFFDRAPLDAYALCKYSNIPIPSSLLRKIKEAQVAGNYQNEVLFVENLGFTEPTEARKIPFGEALRFEEIHKVVYVEWGYRLFSVPRQPTDERAQTILNHITGV